jgi:hypothetical protein
MLVHRVPRPDFGAVSQLSEVVFNIPKLKTGRLGVEDFNGRKTV